MKSDQGDDGAATPDTTGSSIDSILARFDAAIERLQQPTPAEIEQASEPDPEPDPEPEPDLDDNAEAASTRDTAEPATKDCDDTDVDSEAAETDTIADTLAETDTALQTDTAPQAGTAELDAHPAPEPDLEL
ncbi:MAG TPA: hypothetical protein PK781_03730, partial [Terrimesophilobacter sp.]|nr:hypothetical protein [Terrimesophilobacter sp.]